MPARPNRGQRATASKAGNCQIASITALILLVPSVGLMLFIERFLKAAVLAKVGS